MKLVIEEHAIYCNGDNCNSMVPLTIDMEREHSARISQSTLGWLYVMRNTGEFYYCPKCAAKQLTSLYHRQVKPALHRNVAAR